MKDFFFALALGNGATGVHDIRLRLQRSGFYEALRIVPSLHSKDKRLSCWEYELGREVGVVAHLTGTVVVLVNLNYGLLFLVRYHVALDRGE